MSEQDVIVAGAGFGGLVAAATAAERGKRVLVLESASAIGGTVALSSGLMHMYDAPSWAAFHAAFPTVNAELGRVMYESFPGFVAWLQDVANVPMASVPLPSDPYKVSGHTPSGYVLGLSRTLWRGQPVLKPLSELGYAALGEHYLHLLDRTIIRGVRRIVAKALCAAATSRGARVVTGARVKGVTRRSGALLEVTASGPSGEIREPASAVVLATGGFQGNADLLEQYLGKGGAGSLCRAARTNLGDGLRIGLELGGALEGPMDRFYGYPMPVLAKPIDFETDSIGLLACSAYYASTAVLVNRKGERFVDEPAAGKNSEIAHAIATRADGECWAILDEPMREHHGKKGFGGGLLPPMDLLRNSKLRGANLNEAATLDELLTKLAREGVDPKRLRETIDEYNTAAAGGSGQKLSPARSGAIQALRTPPYYGIRLVPGVSMTYGGLRINGRAQLLDASREPLPGLYAVPGLAGGLYTRQYGGALAACGTFGRIAGNALE